MLYGDDKAYEMARSLLPSTGRRQARKARARVSRNTRRTHRVRVAGLARDAEPAEDCAELTGDSSLEMRHVVWHRRARDKVNPFQRWARAQTRDLPRDSRLPHVRGLLPQGLIGEHALGHLSWDLHFESTAELELDEARRAAWQRQRREGRPWLDRGLLAQLLRRLLLLPGGQRAFNDFLKRACARGWTYKRGHDGRRHVVWHGLESIRLLRGVHDVLPFLDALEPALTRPWALSSTERVPPEAAHTFLRAFHEQHGDLAATLAALPRQPLPRG